jgi:hypothetical protein
MYRIGTISTLYSQFSLSVGVAGGPGNLGEHVVKSPAGPQRPHLAWLDASERVSGPTAAIFAASGPEHSDVSTFWSKPCRIAAFGGSPAVTSPVRDVTYSDQPQPGARVAFAITNLDTTRQSAQMAIGTPLIYRLATAAIPARYGLTAKCDIAPVARWVQHADRCINLPEASGVPVVFEMPRIRCRSTAGRTS